MTQTVSDFVQAHVNLQRANAFEPAAFKPHVLIIIDTSGSGTEEEVYKQVGIANAIAADINATVTFAAVDTQVRYTITKRASEVLSEEEGKFLVSHGCGGTDMFAGVTEAIVGSEGAYSAIVVLTDGYTSPASYHALQKTVTTLAGKPLPIPAIAFGIAQTSSLDDIKFLTDAVADFPNGSFLAAHVANPTPAVDFSL